jgi:cyanophycin synthetase
MRKVLTQITIDEHTRRLLARKDSRRERARERGDRLPEGHGQPQHRRHGDDVTDIAHPDIVFLAERISRMIDLDICGIDVMTDDITKPLNETVAPCWR